MMTTIARTFSPPAMSSSFQSASSSDGDLLSFTRLTWMLISAYGYNVLSPVPRIFRDRADAMSKIFKNLLYTIARYTEWLEESSS